MADILQVNTELPADFTPTAPSGLTDEEAASRKPNISHHRPDKSTAQILAENLFTPFNGLNVALAVCLALVGSWRNMLFLGVVVSNTLIGTVQELRARKTIRKLSLLNAPTAHVLRNGQEKTCAPDALVKGDLVILRAGDQVMADAVVTSGQGAANESLLTGESTPMRKQPGDFLLSGSYILEGTFTAQLVYVGDESYAARLTRSAKEIRRPKSVLMTEVNRLIRIVSAALIPIGLLLFCKQFFLQHLPLTTAVPTSVAAMIGMIPEGLILLISVALAVGVIKLGKRNTLVQELYGIETLSRADVLCLDKTGTITTGKMTVDSLLPLSGDEGAMRTQLGRFLSSMDERSGTLDALRAEIPDVQGEKPVAVLPFSSERKKSAVSFADGTTLILGAPTFVLDDAHLAPIRKTLSDCAGRGLRVLVLAEADGCVTETDTPAIARVIGLCLLTDEIRPAAQETLHYFHAQGVALKIISGDDEKTVAAIARKVGLSGGAVDASTLSDDELPDACERYAVFGRVTPTRKKALVEALKAKGHHVAMTGDGVNDIPALKAADCSIAMAGGAAQQTAHDVAAALVGRQDAIGSHKDGGTDVVGNHADGDVILLVLAVLLARDALDVVQNGGNGIDLEQVVDILHDDGQTLQAHAGINVRLGQQLIVALAVGIILTEHEVPDLHEAVTVAADAAGRLAAAVLQAAVIVDLRAGAAGAGRAPRSCPPCPGGPCDPRGYRLPSSRCRRPRHPPDKPRCTGGQRESRVPWSGTPTPRE